MTDAEWEKLCRKCGSCCFEKFTEGNGRYRVSQQSCRYLDIQSRKCRVYHKRLETGEECLKLTPENVAKADWLPEDCAYRMLLAERPDLQLGE